MQEQLFVSPMNSEFLSHKPGLYLRPINCQKGWTLQISGSYWQPNGWGNSSYPHLDSLNIGFRSAG